MLGLESLAGMSFIDVGCGSGLFSLVARRLGARVYSFDYDPQSVACARELRQRYFRSDPNWNIQEGSVLDTAYLAQLGQFDIAYSWGVLHHTGRMWQALTNLIPIVKSNGLLFIAIYNDAGRVSQRWTTVKRLYNRFPPRLRFLVLWPSFVHLWWRRHVMDLLLGRPFHTWRGYKKQRGMSAWWDVVDWVGGYPFEVAKPDEIFDLYRKHHFQLERLRTHGALGCNEFVFRLNSPGMTRPYGADTSPPGTL